MRPLSMSCFSAAAIRARRCDDMPTLSGVARGGPSARSPTAGTASTARHIATMERRARRMKPPVGAAFRRPVSQAIEDARERTYVGDRRQWVDARPGLVAEVLSRQDAH